MRKYALPLLVAVLALVAAGQALSGSLQGGRPGSALSWAWYLSLGSLVLALVAMFAGRLLLALTGVAAAGVVAAFLVVWLG